MSSGDADGQVRAVVTIAFDHRLAGVPLLGGELTRRRDLGLAVGDTVLARDVDGRSATLYVSSC